MGSELARQLYQAVEAEHEALQARIREQDDQIRSMSQRLMQQEPSAAARAEELAAKSLYIEELERKLEARSQEITTHMDELRRLRLWNDQLSAQFWAWNDWIVDQQARLEKVEKVLPPFKDAMQAFGSLKLQLDLYMESRGHAPAQPLHGITAPPIVLLPQEPRNDAMHGPDGHVSEGQDRIECAVLAQEPEDVSKPTATVVPRGSLSDTNHEPQEASPAIGRSPLPLPDPGARREEVANPTTPKRASPAADNSRVATPSEHHHTHTPASHQNMPQAFVFTTTRTPVHHPGEGSQSTKRGRRPRPSVTGSDSEDDLTKGGETFVDRLQEQNRGGKSQRGRKRQKKQQQ